LVKLGLRGLTARPSSDVPPSPEMAASREPSVEELMVRQENQELMRRLVAEPGALPTSYARFLRRILFEGDTLESIASANGVSVQALRTWNPVLNQKEIFPGQELRVITPAVAKKQ